MALKRKRSSPAFSSPASEFSDAAAYSSPLPFFYHHSKPIAPLFDKPTWSWPTYEDDQTSQHLNSRTRKRHRDDRPDEQQVYASTIDRLFQAQRQHPHAEPVLSEEAEAPRVVQPQRTTLHSFWKISQLPIAAPMAVESAPRQELYHDTRSQDSDAMDLDESMYQQEKHNDARQRRICDSCGRIGEQRVCAGCVSERTQ